jgi:predicted GIY-YIG superfamily endonuclease
VRSQAVVQGIVQGERFIFCYVLDANATNDFQRKMNQHKKARTHVYASVMTVQRVVRHFLCPCEVVHVIRASSERTLYKWPGG